IAIRLVLDLFAALQNAAQREQAIGTRQRRLALDDELLRQFRELRQYLAIDAEAAAGKPGQAQRHRDRAALQPLSHAAAQRQLQRIETRRHAHSEVDRLAVDALHLPDPGVAAFMPFCAGSAARAGYARAHTSRRRGTSAVIASAASCNNKAHARHGRAGAQIPSTRPTEYRQHRLLARTFGMGVAKLLDVAIVFGKRARK